METRNNINPRPFQPVSPGCILKEELEARSLPISDFAHKIGLEEFPDFDYASPILDFSIFRGQNRHFCPRLVSFEYQTRA